RVVLRFAGLEELRHARQTARDVAGLRTLGRDTREDVAFLNLRTLFDREDRVDRQGVARVRLVRELDDFSLLVLPRYRRTQIRAARARTPVENDLVRDTGRLVGDLFQAHAFDQALVLHRTGLLGQNRDRVRVPFDQALAALDALAFVELQVGAERHFVAC